MHILWRELRFALMLGIYIAGFVALRSHPWFFLTWCLGYPALWGFLGTRYPHLIPMDT